MNFKMALFIFLVAVSDLSHALYGAKPVSSTALDAVVTLHLSDPEKPEHDFFCSGVLVAPDKVLTTGHCIEVMATEVYEMWNIFGYEPEKLKVKVKGQKLAVADVEIAPTYSEYPGYEGEDLAIITMKKPVVNVKPLKLAARSSLKEGQPVSLVARGKIAETRIKTLRSYSRNLVITTDGSKAGTCAGDSGGALVVKTNNEYQLAGLLSAQESGCEMRNSIAIFARLF